MPNRHISDDLKIFAMNLVDAGEITLEDCVQHGAFSHRTARRLRASWLLNGYSLAPKKLGHKLGRPRKMTLDVIFFLKLLVCSQRDLYLQELSQQLMELGLGYFTQSLLCYQLRRLGLSRKVANCFSNRRSEALREAYRIRIAQYDPYQLVFTDESSFDYRNCNRHYARSPRNRLALLRQPFQRGRRLSFIPALSLNQRCFGYHFIDGSTTGEVWMGFLEEHILPRMNPFPGPDSVLVCDNASIHKIEGVRELVESWGCRIEYLPPYSPDFNPIEKAFGKVKSRLRATGWLPATGWEEQIRMAARTITTSDVEGWYSFSGYIRR